ncbi:hypothetical protein VMCG_09947 [Cytospora schulzeri]|uniref:Rhodopsin domain-containing protein n=1 Tax=Cytospora schulzeri TaxID=448051 RepID=A0A423VF11_9PEZI|nr:hypothetical protein VMCG_09947 [Valsa malicola]
MIAESGTIFTVLGNPDGPHMWNVPACKLQTATFAIMGTITGLLFPISALFVKTSILALYKRIFGHVPLANTLIMSGIAFTSVFYTAVFVIVAAACIPRSQDYIAGDRLSTSFSTRSERLSDPVSAANGVVGAVLDVYILVVPLFFIWGLQTSRKRKASVSLVFMLGSAATIFSIAGAVYRVQFVKTAEQDLTWSLIPIYALNIAEVNVGIVCSCMPVTFVLFKGTLDRSAAWLSGLLHLTTGRTPKPSGANSNGRRDEQIHPQKGADANSQKLPQIPKGTVTGLRSFVRNFGHRDIEKSAAHLSTDNIMLTVVSEDYDYHRAIQR